MLKIFAPLLWSWTIRASLHILEKATNLMKKNFPHLLLFAVFVYALSGCAGTQERFALTVAHVNDTHGHLDPAEISFNLDNVTIRTEAAGFPRLAACVKDLRGRHDNLIFLHAGDIFQGTLYFTKFGGRADCNLFNLMGLDAMALGNHEFDKGPETLADFAAQADFAILSANIDATLEPRLRNRIKPFIIKEIAGRKVGIIGLTTPDTQELSHPGATITFRDPEQSARSAIDSLVAQGVHIIIIISHLGYMNDVVLASRLPEVDMIAGGHTHTLLGDFSALGCESTGSYPTVCKNADNATVLVVQAWEWAKVVGALTASFDRQGRLSAWAAEPIMPVGTVFTQENSVGDKTPVDSEKHKKIRAKLAGSPGIALVDEDAASRKLLDPYAKEVSAFYRQNVALAPQNLVHVRLPKVGNAALSSSGSQVAPLVADAMLWKMRAMGMGADAALVNAGSVRGSIPKGAVSVGQLSDLLPFGNRLVVCRLSGSDIKSVLETGIDRAFLSPENDGAFPYVAGLRYTADLSKPGGKRLVQVELQDRKGTWHILADTADCRIVTNNYLIKGGDGYDLLPRMAQKARDTVYGDAEVFIEYAGMKGQLKQQPEKRITLMGR
jgi:5'-nucleotidase / UDP-sugar diphosphatase